MQRRKGVIRWGILLVGGLITAVLLMSAISGLVLAGTGDLYLPIVLGGAPEEPTATPEPTATATSIPNPDPSPGDCLTTEEATLVNLINDYRNDNGLPDVPVSKVMVTVAQWHVVDLHENDPDSGTDPGNGMACNMHSWSNAMPSLWSPVCYTSNHQYASGMWNKPREISDNAYSGNGFENAYGSSGQATAQGAFDGWRNSPLHNAVILEQGGWEGSNWPAMGVGIYEHHAVLWFGDATDLQGSVGSCN